MWRSLRELKGYKIRGRDGEIGRAMEFYFDDRDWRIRYLIVDTGTWFSGRRVLISSQFLECPDWSSHLFPVTLTRKEIQESPEPEQQPTVSDYNESAVRQSLLKSGDLPLYWGHHEPFMIGAAGAPPEAIALMYQQQRDAEIQRASVEQSGEQPRLRSTAELLEYGIQATDGTIGHVDDFLMNDDDWQIGYVVVDTGNWLPGKQVIISRKSVSQVSWGQRSLSVSLPRKVIQESPEFDPEAAISQISGIRRYDPPGHQRN